MARRIAQSSINWQSISERVSAEQRSNFINFKAKSDGYLRRVMAYPAEPPKIDWAMYKNTVPVAGMVDNFQKQYEALKIPYPVDNYTKLVEAQTVTVKAAIAKFVEKSDEAIEQHKKAIAHLDAQLSYDQMTMEDFYDAHPGAALDPLNNPTFWPHTADDKPGRVGGPDAKADH